MIHVTIEAQNTHELHSELSALLAGESGLRTCWQKPPVFNELVSDSTEEVADFQPAPDPEPVPAPVPVPVTEEVPPFPDSEPAPVSTEPEPVKGPTMEECRAALNALRAKHGPGAVRTILTNHGVNSFVELDTTDYAKVMREAESYEV